MILVTGATGNVGSELVPQLLALGQSVRVLTRDERKVADLDANVERAVGDFDQPETLEKAMQGVDRIFLVTAETQQDINVLEAAKRSGIKHVVKLSSSQVLWADFLPIGRWELEQEKLIEASGLAWTMLRPGQFMSNALMWAAMVKKRGMVIFPGGKGRTAPIDPSNVAEMAVLALTQPGHEGRRYEPTGPEFLTTAQQAQILGKVLGKRLHYVNPPLFVARIFMRRSGMKPELVDALLILAKAAGRGALERPVDTMPQLFGHPLRTFEDWCRKHIAAFQ
jgi:(4-alkanoyl-5-oxo-2,5-dihydrofuran-3-yl)methyl phosphate reductase